VIVLIRHGETEWSRDKRHTGRTDLPLTGVGRSQALEAGRRLGDREWALVLTSPLVRAAETAELAGLDAVPEPDLMEWDYGDVEGLTTEQMRETQPGWDIWRDGPPNGETIDDVGARADRVIARALEAGGDVALVAHGHLLRVLAARYLELDPRNGCHFKLDTAAVCELGFERDRRVILRWNISS
jgi:probable phosphoglycerate mutase